MKGQEGMYNWGSEKGKIKANMASQETKKRKK